MLRCFQKMAVQLFSVWWYIEKLEIISTYKWMVCFTYNKNFGGLRDFITESQILWQFSHWEFVSLTSFSACKHIIFYIMDVFLKGCVWIKFLYLGDSSNLNFFTYTMGENQILFQTHQWSMILFKEPCCEFSLWLEYWSTNWSVLQIWIFIYQAFLNAT